MWVSIRPESWFPNNRNRGSLFLRNHGFLTPDRVDTAAGIITSFIRDMEMYQGEKVFDIDEIIRNRGLLE